MSIALKTQYMICFCRHCLQHLGFNYMLLGKFSSDPIESRFGWYRQCNGGNYYLTRRQLFQNEEKLRVISLMRFSKCTLDEFPDSVDPLPYSAPTADALTRGIAELLPTAPDISSADANAINYVVGGINPSNAATIQRLQSLPISAAVNSRWCAATNAASFCRR